MTESRARGPRDEGRALIEVVFLAVLLLIPTAYIMIGVLRLQSSVLAVNQAARDAGRYVETASSAVDLGTLTEVAAVALRDQHVPTDTLRVRAVPAGADCTDPAIDVTAQHSGADFDLCVTAVVTLPGVPTVLTGSRNTVTGVYSVHVGTVSP